MKSNIFKLSALSAAIVISLSGCGGSDSDNNSKVPVVTDVAPKASDVVVADLKQWLPMTADFKAVIMMVMHLFLALPRMAKKLPHKMVCLSLVMAY